MKKAANNAVHRAVKAGRLVRAACEECGDAASTAHHDDYGKPLSVRWLCHLHHRRWHAVNEAIYPATDWHTEDRIPL